MSKEKTYSIIFESKLSNSRIKITCEQKEIIEKLANTEKNEANEPIYIINKLMFKIVENIKVYGLELGGFVSSEPQSENGESVISSKDVSNKIAEIQNDLDAINENKIECDILKTQSENKDIDHETAEILADEFADKELNVVRSFLGKDYICGFKEGVQLYIKSLNKK